ncbi:rhodanese-like domain-containing protein [Thioalkalivibrio sp.]|uniref:rhodanese-like domain-containing protein n=1 Tax=Thioalkalivibrio sp. TaxID=2093813 RepID=UPI003974BA92
MVDTEGRPGVTRKTLADLVAEARRQIREISPEDLVEAMDDGEPWLIVDLREPYEYERLHVPDSILVPRGLLEGAVETNSPHRIDVLCAARDRPVALLCATGARSALAAVVLQQMGFANVVNIAGGLKLWEGEDLPTASGPYPGPLP